jgi:hypothetical protein
MEIYKRNLPYVLFIALGLKLLILGASSLYDVLALLVLGAGLAFFELRVENKKFQEILSKFKELQEKTDIKFEELDRVKTALSAVRISNGLKQQNVR